MWRKIIKRAGVKCVAREMRVTETCVSKYVTMKAMPGLHSKEGDAMLKRLCHAMFRLLPAKEFVDFLESLAAEITGFRLKSLKKK